MVQLVFYNGEKEFTLDIPTNVRCAFTRNDSDDSVIIDQQGDNIDGTVYALWKQIVDAHMNTLDITRITCLKDGAVCCQVDNIKAVRNQYSFSTGESNDVVSSISIYWQT